MSKFYHSENDDDHCEPIKRTGTLPPYWGWVQNATYVGKMMQKHMELDKWEFSVSRCILFRWWSQTCSIISLLSISQSLRQGEHAWRWVCQNLTQTLPTILLDVCLRKWSSLKYWSSMLLPPLQVSSMCHQSARPEYWLNKLPLELSVCFAFYVCNCIWTPSPILTF